MRRGGFTIVEVLLVLALLAIIAAMVGTGAVGMIDAAKMEPPSRVLKRAVLDAVYHASDRKEPSFLRYHKERATFEVTDATGGILAKHAVYQDMPTDDAEEDDEWDDLILPEVSFLAEGPLAGESGGSTQLEDEHLVLKRIRFQAGVSPPFQAKVKFAGKEEIFNFDPFSGYVIVEEDD
jgi:prepilin-type N-terminal cleavage/methylation domain-containing protein